ncbi:MAG: hypothetical protein IJQ01_05375, partial [Selenomonadaceae bacterium]|nr:hypothetical protein [Selenomonadaceae bacterium]
MTVDLDKGFSGVPITIEGSSTTFTSTDTTKNFTVSTVVGGVSVSGSTAVSLGSGTIKTDEASQSITADGYKVFGYEDSTSSDNGLFVAVSGDKATVGDIDVGETFYVDTNSYSRLNTGLLQLNSSTGKYMLYIGDSTPGDGGAVYVDLDNLTNADNLVSLVAPSNGVFEIGTTHTYSAAAVDNVTNPSAIYASLNAANGSYTLSTIGNGDATAFQTAAGTISLTGGTSTTIHKSLVSSATNIASSTDATFKVDPDGVSGNTFTVNLKTDTTATTIDGATAITLISGTISAQNGQTITLGDSGSVKFASTNNNMTVAYNDSTATVTGSAGDAFTLTVSGTAKTYTVNEDSGTAMTFTIDSSGNVTVNGLDSVNDSFTYDGVNYSVRSAGFVGNSSSSNSLWSATSNHSLTNGSVAVNSLGASANWSTLVTLSSSAKSVTIPPSGFSSPSILIDNDFSEIFGTLTSSGNSYSLSGSGDINTISLSSGVNALSVGGGDFTNVSILSASSSLAVTEDDSTVGYQVTLSSGVASLVGASQASLIGGSLKTDNSSLTVSVLGKGIVASNSTITVAAGTSSTNSSITGVDQGEIFSVDSTAYSLSAVGLVSGSKLLNNTNSAFRLSELDTSGTSWHDMIAPTNNTLTISETTPGAFVVNNTDNPMSLFAELTSLSSGHSMYAASGYATWSDDYTINVDNTKVTLSGGFASKKITGTSSEAAFTTGSNRFVVQDSVGGAIITGANNITQTAGLVFSSVTSQSIAVASSNSVVSYGGGRDG